MPITSEELQNYKLAAERGDAETQEYLGRIYANGYDGVAKDEAEAVKWFKKAAKRGGFYGMNAAEWLGMIYRDGDGIPKDVNESKKWFKLAEIMQEVEWDPTIPFWRNALYELLIGLWKRIWIFRFQRRELSEY